MFWIIIGFIAGFICVGGFIPQILKGYQTKKLNDLSYFLVFFMGFGMFLWILYGFHTNTSPVIFTNIIGVTCCIILIIMKFIYSKK